MNENIKTEQREAESNVVELIAKTVSPRLCNIPFLGDMIEKELHFGEGPDAYSYRMYSR